MSEEIKPCPFCAGKAEFKTKKTGTYCHVIQCLSCGAQAGGSAFRNDEYNTEKWNTRASPLPPTERE